MDARIVIIVFIITPILPTRLYHSRHMEQILIARGTRKGLLLSNGSGKLNGQHVGNNKPMFVFSFYNTGAVNEHTSRTPETLQARHEEAASSFDGG